MPFQPVLLIVVTVLALAAPREIGAQEAGPAANPTAHAVETPRSSGAPLIHRAYVPLTELEAILAGRERGVLMPTDEFEELLATARANAGNAPRTPAGIVLQSAEYTARFDGDRLLVTGTLGFRQLRAGWESLPLAVSGLTIESATIGDAPARIGRRGGVTQLLHDVAGPGELQLELSAPVVEVGSDRVIALQLPTPASATLAVDVPAGKRLLLGGATLPRPAEIDQPATYEFPVGGLPTLRLTVTDREASRQADALLFVQAAVGLDVSPGEVGWRAVVSMNAFGQRLDTLVFEVPADLEIANVDSTGLESWQLDDADPADANRGTIITLNYRQPFEGVRHVTLEGVLTATEGEFWSVPALVVRGATSHVGRIVLDVPRDLRLERTAAVGVRGVTDAPSAVAPGAAADERPARRLAFDYWQERHQLDFVTHVKQRSYQAELSTVVTVHDDRLDLVAAATVTGRFGTTFDLEFTLPAAWDVIRVAGGGADVAWEELPREAGLRTIRVPLPAPLESGGTNTMELHARLLPEVWPPTVAPVEVALPEVGLDATTVEATYVVLHPDWFDILPVDVHGLDPVPSATANDGPASGYRRLAFEYQNGRISGTLRIVPRPARAAVRTLAFARIDEDALRTHLEMEVQLSGSGRRNWIVSLPEALGGRLRFDVVQEGCAVHPGGPVRIIEQRNDEPQGSRIVWTLRFDRRLRGTVVLAVSGPVPHIEGVKTEVPLPEFPAAERHHGFVAVEANGRQRITTEAHGPNDEPLWEVDAVELPAALSYAPRERVVTVLRFILPKSRVRVGERRFERVAVPSAVCEAMTIDSALGGSSPRGSSSSVQHRMSAIVASSGVQAIGLRLPEGGEVWSATVDGAATELRSRDGVHFVQWPRTDAADGAERRLEVAYATPVEGGTLRRFEQHPPTLLLAGDGGAWSEVDVLEREWNVHYPTGIALVRSRGEFRPVGRLDATSLLGEMRRMFASISPSEAGGRSFAVLVVASLLFLITLGGRRWGRIVPIAALSLLGLALFAMAAMVLSMGGLGGASAESAAGYAATKNAPMDEAPMPGSDYSAYDLGLELGDPTQGEKSAPMAPQSQIDGGTIDGRAKDSGGERNEQMQRIEEDLLEKLQELPSANDIPAQPTPRPDARPDPSSDPFAPPPGLITQPQPGQLAGQQGPGSDDSTWFGRTDNGRRAGETARLSVPIGFEPPIGGRSRRFRYSGADDAGATLSVRLASIEGIWAWRMYVAVVVLLVAWFLRRATLVNRTLLAVTLVAVAIGLVGVVPVDWQPTLDGLLLGAFAGVALWIVAAVCGWFARMQPYGIPAGKVVVLLLAVSCGGPLAAEEPSSQPNASPARALNQAANQAANQPANQAAVPATAAPMDERHPSPEVRAETVIVPYADGTDPLAGQRVYVPQATFTTLWNLAHPDRPLEGGAVPEAVVSAANYATELLAGGEGVPPRVAVTATFTVFTFASNEDSVVLPIGEVAARSVTVDGQPAGVVPVEGGIRTRIPEAGRHEVVVAYAVPATVAGPSGRFRLDVADVPAGRLVFPLPAPDLRVRVNGTANTFRLEREGEAARVVVPLAGGGATMLEWRPAAEMAGDAANVLVETTTAVAVSDLGLIVTSAFRVRSRGAGVNELSFAVPSDVRVRRILGVDVGGWSLEGEGDARTLGVFLRRAVTDETTVVVEVYRTGLPADEPRLSLPLPTLAPRDVTRETGRIAIHVDPPLAVRASDVSGLIRTESFADVTAFTVPKTPRQLSYRYSGRPIGLSLEIERRPASLRVEALHAVRIRRHETKYDSRFAYELGDTPRERVQLRLPEEYVPLEVLAPGLDDWYRRETGGRTLVIEFTEARTGAIVFIVKGEVPRAEGEAENPPQTISVEPPTPIDAERTTAEVALFAGEGLRTRIDAEGGWKRVPTERVSAKLHRRDDRPAVATFRTEEERPAAIAVVARPDVPNWTGGDALHLATVDDDKVSSNLLLQWRYDGAATDVFAFTLPESYADRLEIVEPPLRRVEKTPLAGGRTRWTIHAERPIAGGFLLAAQVDRPPVAKRLEVPVPVLERPNAEGTGFDVLDVQNRYAVVVNESRMQLTAVPNDELEAVSVGDIGFLAGSAYAEEIGRATTLARLRSWDVRPAWTTATFARKRAATAAVHVAELTTVLGSEGTWRGRAVYKIENLDRQFLALLFPAGVRPMAATVRGEAQPLVKGRAGEQDVYLVPIPLSSRGSGEAAFEVAVVYSGEESLGRLDGALGLLESTLEPLAPRVVSPRESAEYGIPVGRTRWTVYLPDGYTARPLDDERNTFTIHDAAEATVTPQRGEIATGGYLGISKGVSVLPAKRGDAQVAREQDQQLRDLYLYNYNSTRFSQENSKSREEEPNVEYFQLDLDAKQPPGKPGEGKPTSGKGRQGSPKGESRFERRNRANEQSLQLEGRQVEQLRDGWKDEIDDVRSTVQDRSRIEGRNDDLFEDSGESRDATLGGFGGEVRPERSGLLSLEIELPTNGRAFVFTKTGGDPRLAIAVRADETWGTWFGLGWAALWIGLVITAFVLAARNPRALGWFVPVAAAVAGAIGFILLDGDLAVLAGLVFAVAACVSCVVLGRRPREVA